MCARRAWRDEGLLPVCELLPVRDLAQLFAADQSTCAALLALWPGLRAARWPSLSAKTRWALRRVQHLEASLLYEEFGGPWSARWLKDLRASRNLPHAAMASWGASSDGLLLSGLDERRLDLGAHSRPSRAAFAVACTADAAACSSGGSTLACLALADAARRTIFQICFCEGLPDMPGFSIMVNGCKVALAELPWPEAVEVSFNFDWAAREITDLHLGGVPVFRGSSVDFEHSGSSGVRFLSLWNLHGDSARARWEYLRLFRERPPAPHPRWARLRALAMLL